MNILITRNRESYNYMRDKNAVRAWDNNDDNNSLDDFELYHNCDLIFKCKAQTVTNLTGIHASVSDADTIALGGFGLVAFVQPRLFKCQPHGIINTVTRGGAIIGNDSTTSTNKLRWLMHDQKNFEGKETRVPWSSGCFVVSVANLNIFNATLLKMGVKRGDVINGSVVEG